MGGVHDATELVMPDYDYVCTHCTAEVTLTHPMREARHPMCPHCGWDMVRKLSAIVYVGPRATKEKKPK